VGSRWSGGININSKHACNTISGVMIASVILWGNSGGDAIRGSRTPDSVTRSILNDGRFTGSDGNTYESTQFVVSAAEDYWLQASSPGVDTGDPSALGAGPQDLDNRVRAWDGDNDAVAVVDRGT
jgi:hypothetical protein